MSIQRRCVLAGSSSSFTNTTETCPGALLDALEEKQFMILLPSFILILLILILGVPGNIITICVYRTKMRRTASRIFIISLAVCDLANCLLTLPLDLALVLNFFTFDHPNICSIGRTLTYVMNGISALLLCGIAVDRFRKICRPLKPVFTPKKTKFICWMSMLLGFVVYIPGFLLYGTRTLHIPLPDLNIIVEAKTCLIKDDFIKSKLQSSILAFWFLLTVLVLVVLIVSYVFIGRAVYKRLKIEEKRHNSVSSKRKTPLSRIMQDHSSETSCSFDDVLAPNHRAPRALQEMPEPVQMSISQSLKNKLRISKAPQTSYSINRKKTAKRIRAGRTTVMLFSVTIAYVLSFLPFVVIVLLRMAKPTLYFSLSGLEKSIWNFFLRSYMINAAVNPLLYGFFNKDFRNKMAALFRECCCG